MLSRIRVCRHILKAGAVSLLAAACVEQTDPASETPVDPAAGLYEITLSGAGLLKHVDTNKAPDAFCLTEAQRASFPHVLAENYYKLSPLCTINHAQREGNAIAGEISCMADPKMASGANRFVYAGAVGADRAKVEVRMKLDAQIKPGAGGQEVSDAQLKLAMKAMERMKFVIEAKRTGDCR